MIDNVITIVSNLGINDIPQGLPDVKRALRRWRRHERKTVDLLPRYWQRRYFKTRRLTTPMIYKAGDELRRAYNLHLVDFQPGEEWSFWDALRSGNKP